MKILTINVYILYDKFKLPRKINTTSYINRVYLKLNHIKMASQSPSDIMYMQAKHVSQILCVTKWYSSDYFDPKAA